MAGFFFFGTGDKDVTATDLCGDKSRLSKRSREGGVVTVGARGFAAWIMAKTDGAIFTDLNAVAGRSGCLYSGCLGD